MRVAITGGTGLVGACAVAGLVAAGHDVRLLVRRPEQVARSIGPWGVDPSALTDLVVGEVTDERTVGDLLHGCDAVVHAAAVYSFDPHRVAEMLATNETATQRVLGTAARLGLDPVVHVSSTVTLTRADGSAPDLPLGDIDRPYAQSKIASERVARDLQDDGMPVTIVYPGGVLGPHDPYRGDQSERLRWMLRGRMPMFPRGGMQYVDVRTVADVIVAAMVPGQGPRRYVVPGTHVRAAEYFDALTGVTGRKFPRVLLPPGVARATTSAAGLLQRPLPRRWQMPADREGVEILVRDTVVDDSRARSELGVRPRSFEETLADTLVWLADSGRVPRRSIGRLATAQA